MKKLQENKKVQRRKCKDWRTFSS